MPSGSNVKLTVHLPRTGFDIETELQELDILRNDLDDILRELRAMDSEETVIKTVSEFRPKCHVCGREFESNRGLGQHRRIHESSKRTLMETLEKVPRDAI